MLIRNITTILLSGYFFIGAYGESSFKSLERKKINYRAGIHLDFEIGKKTMLFIEDETLMESLSEDGSFLPRQINYKIGITHTMGNFEGILKHECLHPIDGWSNGSLSQSYNLIEMRYNF